MKELVCIKIGMGIRGKCGFSFNETLYCIYDNGEIEFDSLINPPRNKEAGYPRVGRGVADPKAREKIVEVVNKWIKQ